MMPRMKYTWRDLFTALAQAAVVTALGLFIIYVFAHLVAAIGLYFLGGR